MKVHLIGDLLFCETFCPSVCWLGHKRQTCKKLKYGKRFRDFFYQFKIFFFLPFFVQLSFIFMKFLKSFTTYECCQHCLFLSYAFWLALFIGEATLCLSETREISITRVLFKTDGWNFWWRFFLPMNLKYINNLVSWSVSHLQSIKRHQITTKELPWLYIIISGLLNLD